MEIEKSKNSDQTVRVVELKTQAGQYTALTKDTLFATIGGFYESTVWP
jgi:hypothetical protein